MKTDALAASDWLTRIECYSRAGPQAPWEPYSIKDVKEAPVSSRLQQLVSLLATMWCW